MTPSRLWCLLPAAGIGQRMQANLPKQYLPLAGKTLLEVTLEVIHQAFPQAEVVLPLHPEDHWWPEIQQRLSLAHPQLKLLTCTGGTERADSVLAGLEALSQQAQADDWVLVHDVARPCVSQKELQEFWQQLHQHPIGGLLAAPVADTMKRSNSEGQVIETVERKQLWHALTPQMFRYQVLKTALTEGLNNNLQLTDEASAVEAAGQQPLLIPGSRTNLKVTLPEDLPLAEKILSEKPTSMRIGQGFDVHKFGPGDHVILGGVKIPYEQGLIAHSDGDVLIHALCDALLGACALGDIGHHFPDDDPAYAGADSRELLRQVMQAVTEQGYQLVNADITLIAQAPKMAPHLAEMLEKLAEDLQTSIQNLNIKATTTEKLGFTGRKEGIAAQAVVLLSKP
ncbi:2-C-methyl-D-erythritol 2,4-cyclodiphosphate synthase [Marinospirillum celere]|uniref:Bifunctional enzyme IspD/IspF n=2 Tax=Marinospirillum celere TaxID=1122252 RepID=A0A1I1IV77_9GAMM|nr:2-C-methyl-D-erythritol 2,4-cyclodiphosphate synthase [Marinospirillum celere]